MSTTLIEDIQEGFKNKTSKELLHIYISNNKNKWSDEAFEAIKNILLERNIPIPEQDKFIQKPDEKSNGNKNALPTKRLVNYIIDNVVLSILIFLMVLSLNEIDFPFLYPTLIYFLYYFIFESTSGKTIGKIITKTKVIKWDGSKPEFFYIGLRTLCRFIPLEPFFMKKDYTWLHDSLSSTMVVSDKVAYKTTVCLNCGSELELNQKEMFKNEYICPECKCKIKSSKVFIPLAKCKQCKSIIEPETDEIINNNYTCPKCNYNNSKFRIFYGEQKISSVTPV